MHLAVTLGEPDRGPLTLFNITMLTVFQARGNSSDYLKLLTCTMDHGILDMLQTPLELHNNQLVSILARYHIVSCRKAKGWATYNQKMG